MVFRSLMITTILHGLYSCVFVFFFFQAEDGIRDVAVTGVQTCALPIWSFPLLRQNIPKPCCRNQCCCSGGRPNRWPCYSHPSCFGIGRRRRWLCCRNQIGRASCRERV